MITTDHLSAMEGVTNAPPIPVAPAPVDSPADNAVRSRDDVFQRAASEAAAAWPSGEIAEPDVTDAVAPFDAPLQPRNADGTFAPKTEGVPDATGDPALPEGSENAPEPETPAVVDTITVLDRNGKELPIEISDPEAAEAIRMLKNNGMRKDEFARRIAPVEQKEQELRAFEIMLKTAPEQIVDTMHPDIRRRTLMHLLASDFQDIKPVLEQWYSDDLARREYQLHSKETLSQSTQQVSQQISEGNRIASIQRAIESVIPEHASQQDATDFYRLAATELGEVDTQRGRTLKAEDVPALLNRHLARFGFDQPTAQTPTPGALLPVTPAVAAPQGAKAVAIAAKAAATAQRMAALPVQQQAVRAVAPQGAGTAPAVRPRITSFDQADQAIRDIYRSVGKA